MRAGLLASSLRRASEVAETPPPRRSVRIAESPAHRGQSTVRQRRRKSKGLDPSRDNAEPSAQTLKALKWDYSGIQGILETEQSEALWFDAAFLTLSPDDGFVDPMAKCDPNFDHGSFLTTVNSA
ncbi:hypothetical protein NDU88_009102 [Pleurodeles waltl]|uniref:Uncharacterized protein n=1 Tax=Pleurodeles waltl TaxID=8319 RepID=A0AAV7QUT2_PLEWA|nr:hypothetical protein NDU88_009102 [Pleurodeles waltl]